MGIRLGIGNLSYFPIGTFNPSLAAQWAYQDGFDFFEVVTTRGLDTTKFVSPLPVGYLGGAWHYYNVSDILPRIIGKSITFEWTDVAFFPSEVVCLKQISELQSRFPEARVVRHYDDIYYQPNWILEIEPKMGMTINELIDLVKPSRTLCLDTYHARETKDGFKPVLQDWSDLGRLLPVIGLVHIQFHRETDELEKTLKGKRTEMVEILETILATGYRGDFLLELAPIIYEKTRWGKIKTLLSPDYIRGIIRRAAGIIREIFREYS